jgi:hypothetical protein
MIASRARPDAIEIRSISTGAGAGKTRFDALEFCFSSYTSRAGN